MANNQKCVLCKAADSWPKVQMHKDCADKLTVDMNALITHNQLDHASQQELRRENAELRLAIARHLKSHVLLPGNLLGNSADYKLWEALGKADRDNIVYGKLEVN